MLIIYYYSLCHSVCRSLLEQSADIKGQFARWHQQLTSSRSLSPSASPGSATKTAPLKALPLHSTTSSSTSSSSWSAAVDSPADGPSISPLTAVPETHSVSSTSTSEAVQSPADSPSSPTFYQHSSQRTQRSALNNSFVNQRT